MLCLACSGTGALKEYKAPVPLSAKHDAISLLMAQFQSDYKENCNKAPI